jgi:hypothetical protein
MANTVRRSVVLAQAVLIIVLVSSLKADTGSCGGGTATVPFTDVMGSIFFCQIAEAFF